MSVATTALLMLLIAIPFSAFAQGFVYPVGDPNEEPTNALPNLNGYLITQKFMNKAGHTGVDLANGTEGGEVRAIAAGVVSLRRATSASSGFGNVVIIRHDLPEGIFYSLYSHMQEGSVLVEEGDDILVAGEPIGAVDCTGTTTGTSICPSNNGSGPHLHFAVKRNNTLGCAYINEGSCRSGESFNEYCDPLRFIRDGLCQIKAFTPSPSGNGRAVAFDPMTGKLYYTITASTSIFITDVNNAPAASVNPGIRFGALAWDAKRDVLWGGGYQFGELGNVYQITPTGVKTFQFNFVPPGGNCYGQTPGFLDGLAYDEGPTLSDNDDSLWMSDDAALEFHNVDLSGNLIASFAVPANPRSGNAGCNTGIAVDGEFLWLALQSGPDQQPHDIVGLDKSDPTAVLSSFAFSSTNVPGPEDLAADPVTVPHTPALWSNQFGSPNALKLWTIPSTGMM